MKWFRKLLAEQFVNSDIREFFLPKDLEHFCLGCYKCLEDDEKCPFYDEKNRIMQAVESADLLIFTTPTYCMRASASMKAFTTAAGTGTKSAIKDITNTLFYWGVPYIREYGIAVHDAYDADA